MKGSIPLAVFILIYSLSDLNSHDVLLHVWGKCPMLTKYFSAVSVAFTGFLVYKSVVLGAKLYLKSCKICLPVISMETDQLKSSGRNILPSHQSIMVIILSSVVSCHQKITNNT